MQIFCAYQTGERALVNGHLEGDKSGMARNLLGCRMNDIDCEVLVLYIRYGVTASIPRFHSEAPRSSGFDSP